MNYKDIRIIYEDNHLLVVEKPINIPSQRDISGDLDILTLSKSYLKDKYNKPGDAYLGLVQRLDRPVGGVMVFAKTSKAASRLSKELKEDNFTKIYKAVIHGIPPYSNKKGLTDFLLKDRRKNIVSVVGSDVISGKKAVLDFDVIEKAETMTLVKINLITGRSHQIRVQLANLGYPLYGDQKYGVGINKPGMQLALWSYELRFNHPTLKEEMRFISSPPRTYPWDQFTIPLT